jgi:hypothetical protein
MRYKMEYQALFWWTIGIMAVLIVAKIFLEK